MNEDYSQIFCIIGSKGKFCESYQDYLPPIDPYYLDKKSLQPNEVTNKDSILGEGYRGVVKGGYYEIQQLKGRIIHLQSKLNEHCDKSKKKGFKYK